MLQDLIEEIQKIGDKKLKELEKLHEEEAVKLKEKYAQQRKEAVSNIEKRATEASKQVETRTEMLANTERRKQILSKKRELIESTFASALETLANSPNYGKYLKTLLSKISESVSEGEVVYAKGKKAETQEALTGTNYKLTEEGNFKGGLIIRVEKIEYDLTFDCLIGRQLRDELETKIAHILF
ncbi:MAG: V-type ATP synthase subunit E [Patescibacteria group bacterium]|nr:V-type ATP synthase subunit E [Patescibacteria group bacterium]